jgi:hypothetical protein
VVAAMEDVKIRRSPQQVQDYDRDLRRVRQLQQIQAEQDAMIKAKQLKEKKQAEILAQDINAKKPTATATTTTKSKVTSAKKTNLSMNHFSTPSYRCVCKNPVIEESYICNWLVLVLLAYSQLWLTSTFFLSWS